MQIIKRFSGIKILQLLPFLGLLLLGNSSSIETGKTPFRPGKDHALFFAVKDYDYWSDLKNPIRDAEAIAKALREQYEFDDIKVVPNPSLQTIQETLNQYLVKSFGPDDQLFIFFSGHGTFNDLSAEGFFIPGDAQKNDPFQNSYFALTRLERIVGNIKCNHILLAIDACYSGTFNEDIALSKNEDDPKPTWRRAGISQNNLDAKLNWIKTKLEKRSRICITSGGKERTSDGIDHSPLTEAFLKSLSDPGDDDILTIDELVASLKNIQPEPKSFTFGTHQPDGSFLFIQKEEVTNFDLQSYEQRQRDLQAWKSAQAANTPKAYQDYLNASPQGAFRDDARKALVSAEDDLEWEFAKARNTAEAYQAYLNKYPSGKHASDARTLARPPTQVANDNTSPSIPSHMALVKGAPFQMGDVMGDKEYDNETVHSVTLSDFLIGKNEVTFEEYDAFCTATGRAKPGDEGWGRGNRPVVNVSWDDAVTYCNWRSKQEGLKEAYLISGSTVTANWNANGYRLPTEAEWEYAARGGGKKVRFGSGKDIADPKEINFDASASAKKPYSVAGEYRQKTVPVGSLNSPNALGLHDMSGNVWEWCWDWYGDYPSAAQTNPKGPSAGSYRVLRGGSWYVYPQYCRVAYRFSYTPGVRYGFIGFRLARTL